jgi:hypothetical protein
MSENKTTEYMMLFRGDCWDHGVPAEEVQRRMDKVMAWFESLKQSGKVRNGQALGPEQVTLTAKGSRIQDGPFAESKEAVGGFLIVEAASMDEAIAMAKSNPTLEYGITIDVRPVLEECPIFERARRQMLSQAAA